MVRGELSRKKLLFGTGAVTIYGLGPLIVTFGAILPLTPESRSHGMRSSCAFLSRE